MNLFAEIVLPLPLDKSFIYSIPEELRDEIRIGSRVSVPFGQRKLTGVVVRLRRRGVPHNINLKAILSAVDREPSFSEAYLKFSRRLSAYYYSAWGEILAASLPASASARIRPRISITLSGEQALRGDVADDSEKDILRILQKRPYSESMLRRKAGPAWEASRLARMEKKGWVSLEYKPSTGMVSRTQPSEIGPMQMVMDLTLDATSVAHVDSISRFLETGSYADFLLFGPKEKRESVYVSLIKKTLELRKKVLFLVPEISLTAPFVEKLLLRMGTQAEIVHSRLSEGRKARIWRRIRRGEVDVVLGPRSVILTPLEGLGLVIIDEEQDDSFYQNENPVYDARGGARIRARQEHAVVVSGSAHPSVESAFRAQRSGRLLKMARSSPPKKMTILPSGGSAQLMTSELQNRIRKRVQQGDRVYVLFNRRGFASVLSCRRCGYIPRCERCDIALSFHKQEDRLVCHYCNARTERISVCPKCGNRIIAARGIGVEAVAETLRSRIPQARIQCFDRDSVRTRRQLDEITNRLERGRIDILVGTQFLMHQVQLPPADCVVILSPESTLARSDFRAGQKAFQQILQAGRMASGGTSSEILIHTRCEDHYSIRAAAAHDYPGFFRQEIEYREMLGYPPFSILLEAVFQEDSLRTLGKKTREITAVLKERSQGVDILGPALAPVSRIRGRNRAQIVLKSDSKQALDAALEGVFERFKIRKSIRLYE